MAMGKGIGGMVAAGGKTGGSGVKGAVAARKAASVAAASAGPKATRPTAGKPSGMGVLGNTKAATNSAAAGAYAAKAAAPDAGMGIKARRNTIMDAYKTGGTKAAGKAMGAIAKRAVDSRKKPFGTL